VNGCEICDGAFIGSAVIILEGAVIGAAAKVTAGSVVRPGTNIPPGQLWSGNPAVFVRDLTQAETEEMKGHINKILVLSEKHTYWHELTLEERAQLQRIGEEEGREQYQPEGFF